MLTMKKLITQLSKNTQHKNFLGALFIYLIFAIVTIVNELQHNQSFAEGLINGLTWPIGFIKFLLN